MAGMAHLDGAAQGDEDLEPLLSGYHCIFPRNFDEMMDHHGRVREHWRPFLSMLAALGPDEVNRRFAAADRHLRAAIDLANTGTVVLIAGKGHESTQVIGSEELPFDDREIAAELAGGRR